MVGKSDSNAETGNDRILYGEDQACMSGVCSLWEQQAVYALVRSVTRNGNIYFLSGPVQHLRVEKTSSRPYKSSSGVWGILKTDVKKNYGIILFALMSIAVIDSYSDEIVAPIYMVADASNGNILREQGGDIQISPASLAKIMTLNLSLMDVKSGRLSYSCIYPVPKGGEAISMRPGSSVLGLSRGDESTLLTLQRAVAMISANDAARTLALLSNGSEEDFIARMNRTAADIDMSHTTYTDSDGWSSRSVTTGKDQMLLALYYLKHHPGVLAKLHALPMMIYQDRDRIANESPKKNTNLLLGRVAGVDGLKTGTIPSAGFHFIATAKREGTRFVALVMGLKTPDYIQSLNQRANDAEKLLEWAFNNYYSWKPAAVETLIVPVRHGSKQSVGLRVSDEDLRTVDSLTLKHSDSTPFSIPVDIPKVLIAPLQAGDRAGSIRWYKGGTMLLEMPLRIDSTVRRQWHMRDFFKFNKFP